MSELNRPASATAALSQLMSEKCLLMGHEDARNFFNRAIDLAKSAPTPPQSKPESRVPYASDSARIEPPYQILADGTAIIPICGVLTKYETWSDWYYGCCPTNALLSLLNQAQDDDAVKSILLLIDSPGGMVNGTVEFADAVSLCTKPVNAFISGTCCSGAYWIASQCKTIIGRRESQIGNIGVYSVLSDWTKLFEAAGVEFTLVASGQFKGLGADYKVTDDLIADTRRIITGLYQQFVASVATGRRIDPTQATELADGKAYLGPNAVKLQLIDNLAPSFDAAIQLVSGAAALNSGVAMSTANGAAQPAAGKKSEDDGGDDMSKTLNATITSANSHRDQSRKAMDLASSMGDDTDDETKGLAKQCVAALKSANAEATRAAKALAAKCDDGDDSGDDGGDEGGDDDESKKKEEAAKAAAAAQPVSTGKAATASELMAAFPEEKAFCMDQLTAGASITDAYKAFGTLQGDRLKAANEQNAALSKKLAAEGLQGAVGFNGIAEDKPDANASTPDAAEKLAKSEWKANKDHCNETFISEDIYVRARKHELASR